MADAPGLQRLPLMALRAANRSALKFAIPPNSSAHLRGMRLGTAADQRAGLFGEARGVLMPAGIEMALLESGAQEDAQLFGARDWRA